MLRGRRFDLDLADPSRVPRRAALLLGLGMALLATAGLRAHDVHRQRAEVAVERRQAIAALDRAGTASARPQLRESAEGPGSRAARVEAQRVVRSLSRPWIELLDGLDRTARPDIRLRQMAIDQRFGQLSVEIEAASMRDVLGYTQALVTVPRVSQARLVSFEWRDDGRRRLVARLSAVLDETPVEASGSQRSAAASVRQQDPQPSVASSAVPSSAVPSRTAR